MSANLYRDVFARIQGAGANPRCKDLVVLLQSLGFLVTSGKSEGHKIFVHPELDAFQSSSFNCGHGKNGEVKPNYLTNVLRVLRTYESDLKKLLGEDSNGE